MEKKEKFATLKKENDNLSRNFSIVCAISGLLGAIAIALGITTWNTFRENKEREEREKQLLHSLRTCHSENQQSNRDYNCWEDQKCVICLENPLEIILLPCGHVCLCKNCSDNVEICPMCRAKIDSKSAAYIG